MHVIVSIAAWYLIASVNNVIGKIILSHDDRIPLTVTFVQIASSCLYSRLVIEWLSRSPTSAFRVKAHVPILTILIPLSALKFLAAALSHLSVSRASLSYIHCIKSLQPLFVSLFLFVFHKQNPFSSPKVLGALLLITAGTFIASMSEHHFDLLGLVAAVGSTMCLSLLNIQTKFVIINHSIHRLYLLHRLAFFALIFTLPSFILHDLHLVVTTLTPDLFILLAIDGFLSFLQNFFAFNLIDALSPLTYSIANSSKRLAIIVTSVLYLHNPVTWYNASGIFVTLCGLYAYDYYKHAAKASHLLPVTVTAPTTANGHVI